MRRAQLIAPFGTGAIHVAPDGTALLTAGLDFWYQREADGSSDDVDLEEFEIEEWRLERALGVSRLRLPPDHRWRRFGQTDVPNLSLKIPALRFPRWNVCWKCHSLHQLPLPFKGRKRCPACGAKEGAKPKSLPILTQVQFIAICDYGHLQDFPWSEWVHRSGTPACSGTMTLQSMSGASLADQWIRCTCGKQRNLGRITEANPDGSTYLSNSLEPGELYVCRGSAPWHGTDKGGGCGRAVRGSLRSASNGYFAQVKSAIYIPETSGKVPEKLLEILKNPPIKTAVATLRSVNPEFVTPQNLKLGPHSQLLIPFEDEEIELALAMLNPDRQPEGVGTGGEVNETDFRRPEYEVLRTPQNSTDLVVRNSPIREYSEVVTDHFGSVMLAEKVRETRALWGFTRILPEDSFGPADRQSMLWKSPPAREHSWLPAYVVHGEGIFLELRDDRLAEWEARSEVQDRAGLMQSRYHDAQSQRGLREMELTPRFIALHTFAHVVMNQLTFDCGYSSASLRERLYVSCGPSPMAAVLIYTAAGDSEGTMGGLVRMGKPGNLERVISEALSRACWCSADPVCMELGEHGQGPDSCNMAACHGCALVPETACEEFNRFLDRGLLIGTLTNPQVGYFS